MTRRSKVWLTVASIFTLINLVGAGYAAALGEVIHLLVHVALLVVGGYWVWRILARARQRVPRPHEQDAAGRIEYLQQSVDAMALEVERIGEAQRFHDKLRAERPEGPER